MANLLQELRGVVGDQLGSYGLAEYYIGTVTKESPLEIKISDREILDEDELILTEQVLQKQLDLTHIHQVQGSTKEAAGHTHPIDIKDQKSLTTLITINEGLKVGDFVHLLSVMRGQKFIVLSKIREQKKVIIDQNDIWKWS